MADARALWISGPAGRLEALLRVATPARAAAIVAHPHPLHGGTMHNSVIFHADRELHRSGFTTMRFNFRGTGSSEGDHDEGLGEVQDVAAAASWLRGITGRVPMLLVGFSFGAWCAIRHALADDSIRAVVAIGLAVRRYPFEEIRDLHRPISVVQGSEDEFGSPEEVRVALRRGKPPGRIYVLEGAPHLFPGRTREAGRTVAEAAESLLEELGHTIE